MIEPFFKAYLVLQLLHLELWSECTFVPNMFFQETLSLFVFFFFFYLSIYVFIYIIIIYIDTCGK